MSYNHIMLAVDLGQDTKVLLEKAQQQVALNQAKLTLIHVDPDFSTFYPLDNDDATIHAKDNLHHEGVIKMNVLLESLGMQVDSHILTSGVLEDEIMQQVEKREIDLLMLGHHESGVFRQAFFSPSEPLVRKMPCDLLLIKL